MVVSSSWSEQRVLMRAYAGSLDQTRPTIVLYGTELAIGPAGIDPHSEWGIHVQPPVDGRAQELREQLELAAKRLAGSKGNPPRLADEVPNFEKKRTNMWAPGTPRATPSAERRRVVSYEPTDPAEQPQQAPPSARTMIAPPDSNASDIVSLDEARDEARDLPRDKRSVPFSAPAAAHRAAKGGGFRSTPAPIHHSELAALASEPGARTVVPSRDADRGPRARSWVNARPQSASGLDPAPLPTKARTSRKTQIGFESGADSLGRPRTKPLTQPQASEPSVSARRRSKRPSLAHLVGHTMPLGFTLTDQERLVLNALGKADALTASEVGEIIGVGNGIGWMEELMNKLAEHGLDLIQPGRDRAGEPTYVLRR